MSKYRVRRDERGYIDGIERDGYTVLHLIPGTERNEQEAREIVRLLNTTETEESKAYWAREGLIQRLRKENDQMKAEFDSILNLIREVSELISWRDEGNGKKDALKLIYGWVSQRYPTETVQGE